MMNFIQAWVMEPILRISLMILRIRSMTMDLMDFLCNRIELSLLKILVICIIVMYNPSIFCIWLVNSL